MLVYFLGFLNLLSYVKNLTIMIVQIKKFNLDLYFIKRVDRSTSKVFLFFIFKREFQLITSALDDSSLSTDLSTSKVRCSLLVER